MTKNTMAQGGKRRSAGRVHTARDLYQVTDPVVGSGPSYDYADDIAAALATKGGHLFVSSGGAILYKQDWQLSGCDIAILKPACIAAGLPVIDSRCIDDKPDLWLLAVDVPMVAVGRDASPIPWMGAVSYAPLEYVAGLYRAAGAEVHNLPEAVASAQEAA